MTDEVISEDNNSSNDTPSTPVEPFVLPRLDWYDEEGRIYKDALIENFNAIEARLKELGAIGESLIIDDQGIDVSDIHLDDVTMDDLPAKILNFRSLLDVVNLVNYPLECTFNGKKLVRLAYYNSNYEYKAITNKSLSVNTTNKYVYFNYVNNTVAASDATTSPTNSILIGVFADGSIRGLNSFEYANINALYYLARMSEETFTVREGFDDSKSTIGQWSGWRDRWDGWDPIFRLVGRN